MATSSEYYRTASTTPSHYQPYPTPTPHYDPLYASPPTAWHEAANDSYAGPSPAPFLHYAHSAPSGAPPDYVNTSTGAPQQSTLPSWPASYAPIQHPAHVVSDSANSQGFASRAPAPYGEVEGQTVPQPTSVSARQHQNPSNPLHEVHLVSPEDAFRPTDRSNDLRISSEIPAQPVDPPVPSHPQNSHTTIPRLLYPRSQTAPVPPLPAQLPLQPPLAWDAGTDVPAPIEQQHSSHPSDTIVAVSQHNASSPPWPVFHAGGGTFVSPVYERVADVDQQWALIPAPPNNNGDYTHHPVPLDQVTDPAAAFQAGRRISTKKKAAKVPSSYVERQEKLKVSRRKGPLAEDKREKTHFMRKNKRICVRCRFYKSGCDDGDPCQKCDKIEGHARSFREPCYREHLEDTSLVRRCNGRFNQEEAEFLGYDWLQGSKLYEMEIIWNLPGFGPLSTMHPMRITFRQYFPKRAVLDTATSVWRNTEGEVKAVEQPPYAIYDTASLIPSFERYFSSLQPDIERWIFERVRHDEIAFLTYQEVSRIRGLKQSKLLDLAMRLQCLSVVSQGYGSVWSNNIPGIREYDYAKLGRSNYEAYDRMSRDRPLPGAINHQMDVAALKYLKKLEKICVKELAGLIFKPKIKPWYELFLAFYVIFWNLEYIHRGAERYILSKNGTLIENSVSNVVSNQIKKWDFAFPVLLYHWRCTLRGYSPFRLARDNPEELRERGHIDTEGFEYVTKVANIFDRTGADRYPPPLTGFPATHNCMSSEWIVKLFKEAGA